MDKIETRVLIPTQLKIVIHHTPSSPPQTPQKESDEAAEEPTSSSTGDTNFERRRRKRIEKRNRLSSSEEEEGEETEVAVTSSSSSEEDEEDEEEGENEIGSSLSHKNKKKVVILPIKKNVSVCAKELLVKGVRFGGNEGEIQVLHLDKHELAPLHSHDIRLVFGCVDRIVGGEGEGTPIRVCNWLRFLTPTEEEEDGKEANIVGRFIDGQVDFQVVKRVEEGEQLVASFDIQSLAQLHTNANPLLAKNRNEGPLDLSSSPQKEHSLSVPAFPLQHPHPLLTTPLQRKPLSLFSISSVLQGSKHETRSSTIGGTATPTQSFLRPMPILRTRGRERSLLPCEVCGKAFDRPSLLKRHMRTHTGEKPHICDVCSKGFSTSSSLNTHRRIHSGEKPHQCPVCGKRFTASSNLYYHRMTHNKEKPHKCLLCGKSFPTPGDLKSHQYVHSGSWPYNCPICHRGFSKQTNLRNHLLLHSGDKPHNCHLCGKKFALACNLRAHLRTHEAESQPISTCLTCKRSFISSLNMLINGHCRTCLLTLKDEEQTKVGGGDLSPPPRPPSPRPHPQKNQLPAAPPPSAFYPLGMLGASGGLPLGAPYLQQSPVVGGNPFLEQLFQWNYRFAKETAGNLNMMQQKLLESQMLAHLMIGSSPSQSSSREPQVPVLGLSELIRAASVGRPSQQQLLNNPQDFFSLDLNKFMQQ